MKYKKFFVRRFHGRCSASNLLFFWRVVFTHSPADICLSDKLSGNLEYNFICFSIPAFCTSVMQIQEPDVLAVYIYSHIYQNKRKETTGTANMLRSSFVSAQPESVHRMCRPHLACLITSGDWELSTVLNCRPVETSSIRCDRGRVYTVGRAPYSQP